MNWQPIETAPQHDADILVCCPDGPDPDSGWFYGIGFWFDIEQKWLFFGDEDAPPTYWCPIVGPTERPASAEDYMTGAPHESP